MLRPLNIGLKLVPFGLVFLTACHPTPDNNTPLETVKPDASPHRHTNRLAAEKSPYLLQHAHNPVDWYPWGEAAFAKARAENKPILLSIGYSTCHWCHVMERESFEDEAIGALLREHFVSIKVDREERPDVDKIYMTFVQSTTGSGGWPLNVFLTPDRKPFFGGTYFPPDDRYGRGSFSSVLRQVAAVWRERGGEVTASADEMQARLEIATRRAGGGTGALSVDALARAADLFKGSYDPEHGGFGSAPKFPQPSIPTLLLRHAYRSGDTNAIAMVLRTCDRMAAGGIYDQLGGGFARYSVDAHWLVPHFEKMLYDNAQLAQLYLDAFLISGEKRYAEVVRGILDYVLQDMTHPDGGFYSAEDADSEGQEGKFYCWTHDELAKMLAPDEFNVAAKFFGITKEGNFVDHSHPDPLPGLNVLSVANPDVPEADRSLLSRASEKMRAVRAKRVRPHLDDKVLASWNGLMLGAFARAGVILDEPRYRKAAEQNLKFIQTHLWQAESKTLFHRWRDGERDTVQLLEAYAFLLDGVIHLYEATLDPRHIEFALALAEAMLAKFYDPQDGGFWQSSADATDLILRLKDDYDGAEPSGNAVATLALLKLAAITDREEWRVPAEKTLRQFAARMAQMPQAVPYLLQALDFSLQPPRRVVIAGESGSSAARHLLQATHAVYQPNKVVLGNVGPVEEFARTLPAKDGPTVYLCVGTACQPPTTAPERVKELLRER
jgi:hypothetical protein